MNSTRLEHPWLFNTHAVKVSLFSEAHKALGLLKKKPPPTRAHAHTHTAIKKDSETILYSHNILIPTCLPSLQSYSQRGKTRVRLLVANELPLYRR